MAAMVPLSDASRRPLHFPIITVLIIIANFVVFWNELQGGNAFVLTWAAVPAHIMAGRDLITILTSMFMHASWLHILGNMVFLWAFGPQIEDAMGPFKYLIFYLLGRTGGHAGADRGQPQLLDTYTGGERRDCGGDGRVSDDVSYSSDSHASCHFYFYQCADDSGRVLNWVLAADAVL